MCLCGLLVCVCAHQREERRRNLSVTKGTPLGPSPSRCWVGADIRKCPFPSLAHYIPYLGYRVGRRFLRWPWARSHNIALIEPGALSKWLEEASILEPWASIRCSPLPTLRLSSLPFLFFLSSFFSTFNPLNKANRNWHLELPATSILSDVWVDWACLHSQHCSIPIAKASNAWEELFIFLPSWGLL